MTVMYNKNVWFSQNWLKNWDFYQCYDSYNFWQTGGSVVQCKKKKKNIYIMLYISSAIYYATSVSRYCSNFAARDVSVQKF